jgi:hypothetical protein
VEYIQSHVEPYLIMLGWVKITPKGRQLTATGKDSLPNREPVDPEAEAETATEKTVEADAGSMNEIASTAADMANVDAKAEG